MGGMTEAQAEHIAQRARAEGEYGEITVHHQEGYGYSVTGRKVVNGQGIGRTWGYGDILLERATCGHPPSRYYGYVAADGTIVMGCCDCGAVLTGAAKDETPAGGVPAGRDDRRGTMQTESTYREMTIEHLGGDATEADLAAFVAACANYQAATGASDAAATDHIWHEGDCWARVAEWAPAEAADADAQGDRA